MVSKPKKLRNIKNETKFDINRDLEALELNKYATPTSLSNYGDAPQ